MADIKLNPKNTYTFSRFNPYGAAVYTMIIDGTDRAHAAKRFANQVEITSANTAQLVISGSSNVSLNMLQSNATAGIGQHAIDMNGRSLNRIQMGVTGLSGTSGDNYWSMAGYNGGNIQWSIGQDMSDSGDFKLYAGSTLGTAVSFTGFQVDSTTRQFRVPNTFVALEGLAYTGLAVPANHGFAANTAGTYALRVFHDGNVSTAYGMEIIYGTDAGHAGTNYAIGFKNGDNSILLGAITSTGTTVTYGPFTGTHQSYILESDNPTATVIQTGTGSIPFYPPGSIIVNTKTVLPSGSFQPDHYIVTSSAFQDKRVFGVYWSAHSMPDLIHQHQIAAVGDGMILVCNENGNIENGDYITTASGSGGHGCKQNDDLLHNYTVAKACEDVDWATEPSTKKLISCTYHCG